VERRDFADFALLARVFVLFAFLVFDFDRAEDRVVFPRFFVADFLAPDFELAARGARAVGVRPWSAAGPCPALPSMASDGSIMLGRSMSPFIRSMALLPDAKVGRLHEMCTSWRDRAREIRLGDGQKIAYAPSMMKVSPLWYALASLVRYTAMPPKSWG
jgi:hypothetical protein